MTAAPRRRLAGAAVAGLLLLPALSGCFDQQRQATASPDVPAVTAPPPAPSDGRADPFGGIATATPSQVTAASASAVPTGAVRRRAPMIRYLVATPGRVDPRACTPPDPPERPEVAAEVDAFGLDVAAVVVTLTYSVSGTDYQGEARMRYDPARKAFVYRLPPVTRAAVGEETHGIWLSAQAAHPFLRPDLVLVPPPTIGWIAFNGRCLVIQN